jgi:hypothetical protein
LCLCCNDAADSMQRIMPIGASRAAVVFHGHQRSDQGRSSRQ